MGDAVHAMPLTAANGATTALNDARILASQLNKVAGSTEACSLMRTYEDQMRNFAADSIERSMAGVRTVFIMRPFEELAEIEVYHH